MNRNKKALSDGSRAPLSAPGHDAGRTDPIPVRLGENMRARLEIIAAATGLAPADILKLCFYRFFADSKGDPSELFRPDWPHILASMDSRKPGP